MFEQIGKLTFKVIDFLNFKKKALLKLELEQKKQQESEDLLREALKLVKKKEINLDFLGTKPLNIHDLLNNTDMLLQDSGISSYVKVNYKESMYKASYILRMKQKCGNKYIHYELDYNQFIGCDSPYEIYRGILGMLYRKLMHEPGVPTNLLTEHPQYNIVIKNIEGE